MSEICDNNGKPFSSFLSFFLFRLLSIKNFVDFNDKKNLILTIKQNITFETFPFTEFDYNFIEKKITFHLII